MIYSQILDQFKKGNIDFTELKKEFLNYGITIKPVVEYVHTRKPTPSGSPEKSLEKRISEQNYLYDDIDYFILNSDDFKNVAFRMDFKAVESLANAGFPEYQEMLISMLKALLKHSYDKDEIITTERAKIMRRISELELQLSKKNTIDKPRKY